SCYYPYYYPYSYPYCGYGYGYPAFSLAFCFGSGCGYYYCHDHHDGHYHYGGSPHRDGYHQANNAQTTNHPTPPRQPGYAGKSPGYSTAGSPGGVSGNGSMARVTRASVPGPAQVRSSVVPGASAVSGTRSVSSMSSVPRSSVPGPAQGKSPVAVRPAYSSV